MERTRRLSCIVAIMSDEEIYRLTRDPNKTDGWGGGMPYHRAGIRMTVEGAEVDPRFRGYEVQYYGLAEPAYGVDEARRRPIDLTFKIKDAGGLSELRKYSDAYSIGDTIVVYVWLVRLTCKLTRASYIRIYNSRSGMISEIVGLGLEPSKEHPQHTEWLMAGYELIGEALDRFLLNGASPGPGRPKKWEWTRPALLDAMNKAALELKPGEWPKQPWMAETLGLPVRTFTRLLSELRIIWKTWCDDFDERRKRSE